MWLHGVKMMHTGGVVMRQSGDIDSMCLAQDKPNSVHSVRKMHFLDDLLHRIMGATCRFALTVNSLHALHMAVLFYHRSFEDWNMGVHRLNIRASLLFLLLFPVMESPQICTALCAETSDDSLSIMIGQMLMVGFRGLNADAGAPILKHIRETHVGGVVLFDYDVERKSAERNVASPEQLRSLILSLRAAAPIPLFIAVDQEGGKIARLKAKHGFPAVPSQQQLGMADKVDSTKAVARRTASTLVAAGINVNFAPVLDLNTNPANPIIGGLGRSFGADTDLVASHGRAVAAEHEKAGIMTAMKHFPGHGSSRTDSHAGFVDVSDTWQHRELAPFAVLIREDACCMVMTAHIFNRKLDDKNPATLSRKVITGLLRDSLGFHGVVVSDDLQMRAITDNYGLETAIVLAVHAGVDILLFGNNAGVYDEAIAEKAAAILRRAVDSGRITRERIVESFNRIMNLKARYPGR